MPPHSVFKGEEALPLVLRHSDVRKDIRLVCSLICASKGTQQLITYELNGALSAKCAPRHARLFAAWLARHGSTLRKLGYSFPNGVCGPLAAAAMNTALQRAAQPVRGARPSAFLPAAAAVASTATRTTAAAAAAASSAASTAVSIALNTSTTRVSLCGLPLQSCSLINPPVPAALSQLAATATCLSRLELNFSALPVPPKITSNSFADALPALTNLCSLKVALPEDQQIKQSGPSSSLQPKFSYRDFCVLPKPDHSTSKVSRTSSLTRLTELQLLGMTNVYDIQQCIPVQVVSLQLSYNLGSLPVGDLQLGHLTALTTLTVEPCGGLSSTAIVGTGYVVMEGDVLPDSIKSLNITDTDTAAALEHVTQLRQLTLSAPSLSAQELRQLGSLHSSLTALSLNYSCRHGYQCCMIDAAAKAWSSLSGMLQRLVLDMGSQAAGGVDTANKQEDDQDGDDDDDGDDGADHSISTIGSSSSSHSSGQKCGYRMPAATLERLGSLTQLTALVLKNVSINARQDQVAAVFTQLRKLHTLQVCSLQLESKDALGSSTLALSLLGLLNLRQLQLSSLDEDLVETRPLSLLCQLTALDLSHTQGLDPGAVGSLSRLAGLRQLRLAGTCGVTDASVQCLVLLKQLTLLDVRGTALAPAGAKKLMSSLRGLRRLKVDKALAAAIQ